MSQVVCLEKILNTIPVSNLIVPILQVLKISLTLGENQSALF